MKTPLHHALSVVAIVALAPLSARCQGVGLYVPDRDMACQASRRVKS